MVGEEGDGLLDEADRARALLVRANRDIGNPGRVVDRDVEIVVSDRVAVSRIVAEHAVTAARRHPAEALDVDMDQLARSLSDIADGSSGQSVGMGQAAQAMTAEDAVHRGARVTQERTEAMRPDPQPAADDRIRRTSRSGKARGR